MITAKTNGMEWKFKHKDMKTGKLPTGFDLSSAEREKGMSSLNPFHLKAAFDPERFAPPGEGFQGTISYLWKQKNRAAELEATAIEPTTTSSSKVVKLAREQQRQRQTQRQRQGHLKANK